MRISAATAPMMARVCAAVASGQGVEAPVEARLARLDRGDGGVELVGRHVVAVFGGLADGVGDRVGLVGREIRIGERSGDSVGVEHRSVLRA